MHIFRIDIETFSDVDLLKEGLYKYVESPLFEILLFSYQIDDQPTICIDLKSGELLSGDLLNKLNNPTYLKTAWNANFEITCINKYFSLDLDISQWECTMIKAAMLSFPLSLEKCGKAMKLDIQKSSAGKALIKYFSVPCKPTNSNGQRTRNLPADDPLKWKEFKEYNIQDVKSEQAIGDRIHFFKIPEREKQIWRLDQQINNTGILVDLQMANKAVILNIEKQKELTEKAIELTGLKNPNSVAQLKEWLSVETDTNVTSLGKDNVKELAKEYTEGKVNELLQLRQEMSKASINKYSSMVRCTSLDGRARGLFQFYGANKTGRWSGRLIQVQNLTHTKLPNLQFARNVIKNYTLSDIEMLYDSFAETLSMLVRTTFIAKKNHSFLISDLSAIEARITAWFANEKWRLDVFADHGKIYEASGSQMFKLPIEQVVKDVRSKAKVAELALGYQGGVNAMERMGAYKMGLKPEELDPLVKLWRKTNPNIVNLWYTVQRCAIEAIEKPGIVIKTRFLSFVVRNKILFIQLPVGRLLAYINPWIEDGQWGPVIRYYGIDQITKKWSKQTTYGGKIVENIVQGTARDVLADIMIRLDENDFNLVMHVHDEIIAEEPNENIRLNLCEQIMRAPIDWAPGLPLNCASIISPFYLKD